MPIRPLEERLRDGPGEWVPLEDFAPLPRCLEWRLSRQYWGLRGPAAFFGGEVPYVAINDGRLSADAARLLVEIRASAPGPVRILEVGGGSGLFARLFLDELRILSPALYNQTSYVWTDATEEMVRRAAKDGIFDAHGERVRPRVLEVPGMASLIEDGSGPFDMVIANYLVDNLPATLLRLSENRLEELEVRASLRADLGATLLGGRTPQEWQQCVRPQVSLESDLLQLYPWLSIECRFRPVERASFAFCALIPEPAPGAPRYWPHHVAAWVWLREVLPLVAPGGGVLINDYGCFPLSKPDRPSPNQRFGGSLANGVNFDELNSFLHLEAEWQLAAPESDSRQLCSRWLTRRTDSLSAGVFRLIFDGSRRDQALDQITQACARADEGRYEEARWLFMSAFAHTPRCWHLLERWATFCLTRLKDPETAFELAEAGLKLNPHHPALWNIKGDAHYEKGNLTESEICFRRAVRIHPREVRGRLNLAYVFLDTGRLPEALAVLAEAMALDTQGECREALLEKQRQVLQRLAATARDAQIQQLNRFRNLDAS